MQANPRIRLLESPPWRDYELLDSGNGLKLERFGPYRLVRPEAQAMWQPALPQDEWSAADATFQPTGEESGGRWQVRRRLEERWQMRAPLGLPPDQNRAEEQQEQSLRVWAMATPGRHLGLFPEAAAHWAWMAGLIARSNRSVRALNLFGYTGLASLAAAAAGAAVTHVDASKKAISWAKENQALSGLGERPIRWIVDDALKFVRREGRRGVSYDGILLEPPKFGRGPKGEVWEVYNSLPGLLAACRAVLGRDPLFVILTVYAVRASAVHLYAALDDMLRGFGGTVECGELVIREKSAGRLISNAVFARWSRAG
jgi:23S rRNA (cytosine1962-C5)-methyltransferase